MFNRNNLPSMPSPFGARDDGSNARPPPPRDPYASSSGRGPAPPADSRRNVQTPQNMRQPQGAQHPSSLQVDGGRRSMQPPSASSYGGPAPGGGSRGMAPGSGAGTGATRSRQGASGHTLQMRPTKSPDSSYIFRNLWVDLILRHYGLNGVVLTVSLPESLYHHKTYLLLEMAATFYSCYKALTSFLPDHSTAFRRVKSACRILRGRGWASR